MKRIIKGAFDRLLSPMGLELVRKRAPKQVALKHSMPTCQERLAHANSIGFDPCFILDGGAYTGDWTIMAASLFPNAEVLVIEPNPHIQATLHDSLQYLPNKITISECALADVGGTLPFNIWGDPADATSASLQRHVKGGPESSVDVVVETLDNLLQSHVASPDLVKLDLQGAELNALLGAQEALKTSEMFIVEFGCLEAYIDRTTPRQLMEIFYDNNYCLYDVVDCHYRPFDGALTGGDFFFVKNDSPLRVHKDWD